MSLSKIRKDLHKLIDKIEDKEMLKGYKKLMQVEAKRSANWWDDLTEEQRKEVEESMEEIDKGLGIPHEEVMAKYKKWL